MAKRQYKLISAAIAVLGFFVGLQSFAAKRYMVKFNSPNTFKELSANFYQAPIHGLQNMNDGSFELNNGSSEFLGLNAKVETVFENLNAAVVVVENEEEAELLRNSGMFSLVEEDVLIPAPPQIATHKRFFSPMPFEGETMETPWGINAVKAPAAWRVTKGKGVKVLVIDTGIDRDHPDLKMRFQAGKNFIGRGPGSKAPYDYFDDIGHGTHVASTALAGGRELGLVGVAPEASLWSGRVCGTFGCSTIGIVSAVEWGISLGVDVMNLSLGGPFLSAMAKLVYIEAVKTGSVVVAASGNNADRPNYSGGMSYPAAMAEIISVGAIGPNLERVPFSQYSKELDVSAPGVEVIGAVPVGTGRASVVEIETGEGRIQVESRSFVGSSSSEDFIGGQLVYAGYGKTEDFTSVDLTGKFALIKRGEKITFKDKVDRALAAGATGVIIFNNVSGLITGGLTQGEEVVIPVSMIKQELGESIVKRMNAGESVTAYVRTKRTNYAEFAGTSMASPHVAGVVALIRGANPNLSVNQVREILRSTAQKLTNSLETGSGLVNAELAVLKAIKTEGQR